MSPMFSDVDLQALGQALTARLDSLRRSLRRHFLAEGVAILAGVLLAAAALSLLLDWRLELSRTSRFLCIAAFVIGLGWLAYRHLIRPLTMPLSPLDIAAAIDRAGPGLTRGMLATQVATVLELPSQADQPESVSPALISRAVAERCRELDAVNLRSHLNRRHFWLSVAAVGACVLIPAAFAVGAPGVAKLWRDRWLLGSDRPWPHSTILEVLNLRDGRLIVPRGEPSPLQVTVKDSEKETEAVWMRLNYADGSDQTVTLNRFAAGDFRFDLPPLQEPVDVEMWGGDGRAEPFRIEPFDRPKITTLKLTAKHPREPEAQTFVFAGDEGNVRLLPQTEAALEFETNVPVETVKTDSDANAPPKFSPSGDQKFQTRWTHDKQVRMRVSLVARDSGLESFPRPILIGDKPDRAPTITMRHSGVRLRVTPVATIPLAVTVRDDYGIHRVSLIAAVESGVPSSGKNDADEDLPVDDGKEKKEPNAGDAPGEAPPAPAGESKTPATSDDEPLPDVPPPIPPTSAASKESQISNLKFTTYQAEAESSPPAGAPAAEDVFDDTPGDNAAEPPAAPLPTQQSLDLYGPIAPALETVVEPQHNVELSTMAVQPGQSVAIVTSADDDCFTGRQTTASRKLVFKIVKEDELFREILLRQQQLRARLQKSYEQMISLRDGLKATDVQADGATLLRTYLLIRREIAAVTRDLEASVLEMRLNKLGGAESWELIQQSVLVPLGRLQEQELERQKQALETFVGSTPEPLEEVLERQQSIIDSLKKILDNMSQWDSFIDIVNQVNSIIKIQEAARRMTEELKAKQVDSIFDN